MVHIIIMLFAFFIVAVKLWTHYAAAVENVQEKKLFSRHNFLCVPMTVISYQC